MRTATLIAALALSVSWTNITLAEETVRIGVVPGAYADSIVALVPEAAEAGITIETIEFTDWTTPNLALDSGDIDLNYFQHLPFLQNAIADRGLALTEIGAGVLANIGLYSLRHDSFDDIPEDGTVAVPNDPVNQGRGLLLLQSAGLIELREGVGFEGSLTDIIDNPRNLSFTEIEGPQLARITTDVDLAVGYPHFIVASGEFDPGSGLIYSGVDDAQFSIVFAVKKDNADRQVLKDVVELYHNSDAVRDAVHKSYASNADLYTLPWTH